MHIADAVYLFDSQTALRASGGDSENKVLLSCCSTYPVAVDLLHHGEGLVFVEAVAVCEVGTCDINSTQRSDQHKELVPLIPMIAMYGACVCESSLVKHTHNDNDRQDHSPSSSTMT
jgi:hypothetical protein